MKYHNVSFIRHGLDGKTFHLTAINSVTDNIYSDSRTGTISATWSDRDVDSFLAQGLWKISKASIIKKFYEEVSRG